MRIAAAWSIATIWSNVTTRKGTRADIKGLHGKIGRDRPYEANRLLMLLTVLFKFAVNEGFVAGGTPNPAIGIEKFKEEKRDRWVMP